MIVSRIEADDLVEECAVVMWNISRELMSDQNRFRVHKPLQRLDKSVENIRFMDVYGGFLGGVPLTEDSSLDDTRCMIRMDEHQYFWTRS